MRSFFALKKSAAFSFLGALFCASAFCAENVRPAYVAGQFYPAQEKELSDFVDSLLLGPRAEIPAGKIAAMILPHAGYEYSGKTAAVGYRLVKGAPIDTVILIGPCHRALFPGASIWKTGQWITPLGSVEIDSELAFAIASENQAFRYAEDVHRGEHSLEVHLPFLQRALGRFKIVPILISDSSAGNCERLARAVSKHIAGRSVLVIGSTDMTHYLKDSLVRSHDEGTMNYLAKEDVMGLRRYLSDEKGELCGEAAALTVLEIVKTLGASAKTLGYSTSAEATQDKSRVVGYGATAFFLADSSHAIGTFSDSQKAELLSIARESIKAKLSGGKPQISVSDPAFEKPAAVFVTLKKNNFLRGCIGQLTATESLYRAVGHMAVQAATQDPRFPPVTLGELPSLNVHVSVLSKPEKIAGPQDIVLGKHGVILHSRGRSGVFLPEVADETGWSKETFLNELCSQKAGLSPDCWKDKDIEFYVFTSEGFGEHENLSP